jgi:hypothetical protein
MRRVQRARDARSGRDRGGPSGLPLRAGGKHTPARAGRGTGPSRVRYAGIDLFGAGWSMDYGTDSPGTTRVRLEWIADVLARPRARRAGLLHSRGSLAEWRVPWGWFTVPFLTVRNTGRSRRRVRPPNRVARRASRGQGSRELAGGRDRGAGKADESSQNEGGLRRVERNAPGRIRASSFQPLPARGAGKRTRARRVTRAARAGHGSTHGHVARTGGQTLTHLPVRAAPPPPRAGTMTPPPHGTRGTSEKDRS